MSEIERSTAAQEGTEGALFCAAAQALPQALQALDLPAQGRFVLLLDGWQGGHAVAALWRAWHERKGRGAAWQLIVIDPELPARPMMPAHAGEDRGALSVALNAQWPPAVKGWQRLALADGGFVLLLVRLPLRQALAGCVAEVDAFVLQAAAAQATPDDALCKGLARLAVPGAQLLAAVDSLALRAQARSAGFVHQGSAAPHWPFGARYRPAFQPRRAPSRIVRGVVRPQPVLIVGGGLAGCAAAAALAEQGWPSTVLDRHAQPAVEASGNWAGLFHGTVNPQDGAHARFNRAAAIALLPWLRRALADGVRGQVSGLLRLQSPSDDATALQLQMHAQLRSLQLPRDYVQALDAVQASELAGMALQRAAWFYPGGGWVDPAALAAAWLAQAGQRVRFRGGVVVNHLRHDGHCWQAVDAQGALIDQAPVLVLANAGDALRLLGHPPWPLHPVRGQLSLWPAALAGHTVMPRVPLVGQGYALALPGTGLVFGATWQPGDLQGGLRDEDHARNREQLAALSGLQAPAGQALQGRVGWRWVSSDRLPLIGPVPVRSAAGPGPAPSWRWERLAAVPRQPGLFIFAGLGSRGITWSALGSQVLAAAITGAPAPLESSLLDALDPARFLRRSAAI